MMIMMCLLDFVLLLYYGCRHCLTLPDRSFWTAPGRRSDVLQPGTDAVCEPGTLNACTEHICRLEISQVKLGIYRVSYRALSIF